MVHKVAYPLENNDLKNVRKEYFFRVPQAVEKAILPLMADPRDMPMIHLLFNIMLTVVPSAFIMFTLDLSGWMHLVGLLHFLGGAALFLPRFILCMHYSSHRFIFTKYTGVLNNVQTHVIAPLFGIPSGMYYLHHCIMHHGEGNVFPEDWSSTEMYQRDNFLHFMHYWAKFFASFFYLPYYAINKGRSDLAINSGLSCAGYFLFLRIMYNFNPAATMYVFVLPFILTSFALMFGNWSQHMFLDPKCPESPWSCTFNAMNALDNTWTFNDGYHIVHHVNSRCHWTDMPQDFMKNLSKYSEKDALVFDGLGFFDVGLMVMLGRLDQLAEHYVQWDFIGGKRRTRQETVQMFKDRLKPVPMEKRTKGQ